MRNIRIVPYDPSWPSAFQQEAVLLGHIFGADLIAVYHIGSTAVPGLPAKPVIDMLPLVRDIQRVDLFGSAMMAAGYHAWGEHGIPGRRLFTKGGDEHRTHNVHIFAAGSPDVARHLDFRNYLSAHADVAQRYAELKAALAAQHPNDIAAYNNGKAAFIKDMEQRARKWREQQLPPTQSPRPSS
jgi:GrpB-like predicted nucleotidyltransferase (UPF0157 family)